LYGLLLPLVGFAVGLLVAMTGVGAGSVMTPLLLAVGLPPISAVGTDLVHSALSKALGTSLYLKSRSVNRKAVAYLMTGSVAAIALGGYLIVAIRGAYGVTTLNLVVSVSIAAILLIAGTSYLLTARDQSPVKEASDPAISFGALSSLGFLIGLAVNMTSVGAGSMLMPYLMRKLKSAKEMVGTDLAYGFLTTAVAGIVQLDLGDALLVPLLYLLAGSIPGTYVGVKVNERVHVRHMRLILSLLIMASGVSILARLTVG
jgi:uncharacterized membrane protein YfcA